MTLKLYFIYASFLISLESWQSGHFHLHVLRTVRNLWPAFSAISSACFSKSIAAKRCAVLWLTTTHVAEQNQQNVSGNSQVTCNDLSMMEPRKLQQHLPDHNWLSEKQQAVKCWRSRYTAIFCSIAPLSSQDKPERPSNKNQKRNWYASKETKLLFTALPMLQAWGAQVNMALWNVVLSLFGEETQHSHSSYTDLTHTVQLQCYNCAVSKTLERSVLPGEGELPLWCSLQWILQLLKVQGDHDGIQSPIFGEIFVDIFCFFSFLDSS